jgi:hypothetical protein
VRTVEDVHDDAEKIILVVDKLNTHGPWCLYEAFEPERARRIAARLEWGTQDAVGTVTVVVRGAPMRAGDTILR